MLDAFLKIDGIDGESTDEKHLNWIEVLEYSQGFSNPRVLAGRGNPMQAKDITIKKYLDRSSCMLYLAISQRQHFDKVVVEMCRAGGDKFNYLHIELSDVVITSVETVAVKEGKDGLPIETLLLSFARIEWDYNLQRRLDGTGGGGTMAVIDIADFTAN